MDKPEKPKDQEKKPIADVEEPGKSAPAPTSKPVLVTNRPVLQDPMVVGQNDEKDDEKPAEKRDLKRTGTPTIQPLNTPDKDDSSATAEADKPAVGSTAIEAEEPPEPKLPEKSAGEPAADERPVPETPPSDKHGTAIGSDQGRPVTDAEKKLQAEATEQAKHDAAIQKLVDEGQYVLPINTVEKRKAKNFIVLGAILAIVLVLAWLDIALDAHIISLGGIHPVTHLFSN